MVEVKQNREQDRKRDRDEHVADLDVLPEMHEPGPIRGGEERGAGRQPLELHALHAAEVHEAGEEHDRQWRAVVF